MAAFRSNHFRRILSGGVILGSVIFLGASFAPSIPYGPNAFDPVASVHVADFRVVADSIHAGAVLRKHKILCRLEELVLTHRAVSVSV